MGQVRQWEVTNNPTAGPDVIQEEPLGTGPYLIQLTGASLGEEGMKINRHSNTTTQVSIAVPVTEFLVKKQASSPSPGGGKMALLSIARL